MSDFVWLDVVLFDIIEDYQLSWWYYMLFASIDSDNAICISCTMILFSSNNQKISLIKMLKSKSDSAGCEHDHIMIIFRSFSKVRNRWSCCLSTLLYFMGSQNMLNFYQNIYWYIIVWYWKSKKMKALVFAKLFLDLIFISISLIGDIYDR